MDSKTNSMDMSLSKEIVKDREASHAAVHGVAKTYFPNTVGIFNTSHISRMTEVVHHFFAVQRHKQNLLPLFRQQEFTLAAHFVLP